MNKTIIISIIAGLMIFTVSIATDTAIALIVGIIAGAIKVAYEKYKDMKFNFFELFAIYLGTALGIFGYGILQMVLE